MGRALEIGGDLSAAALRAHAAREKMNRAARQMRAIANALDNMRLAEAARAVGMDRQALRDAVVRYNAEGLAGLHDRPTPGRPQALTEGIDPMRWRGWCLGKDDEKRKFQYFKRYVCLFSDDKPHTGGADRFD